MENRYNKEYEQYYIYALEQFLIKIYGFSEHDAKVKVMQDFDEVKEDFDFITIIEWRKLPLQKPLRNKVMVTQKKVVDTIIKVS